MQLVVRGQNFEVTDAARDYATRKLSKLDRYLNGENEAATTVDVELRLESTRSEGNRFIAEVNVTAVNGVYLRGEERGSTMYEAIDRVVDIMERRVGRFKERTYLSAQAKKTGRVVGIGKVQAVEAEAHAVLAEAEQELEAASVSGNGTVPARVVRVKRFPMKPMDVDEAAFRMESLGHDFFLFLNTDTNRYNVLYKRNDGDYGLIDPVAS